MYVDPDLIQYAVRVSNATRDLRSAGLDDMARYVTFGVSPRASIYMVLAAQALALLRGRDYALPENVYSVAPDLLRHRLVLSYEALGDNVTTEDALRAILAGSRCPSRRRVRSAPSGDAGDVRWAPPPG